MRFSLALLTILPATLAHFTLDFPLTRGFVEDNEPQFCGGFPNPLLPRQVFPLGSAPILISSYHPTATIGFVISFDSNPTSFANFNQTSNGTTYAMLKGYAGLTGQGKYCLNVDVGALKVPGVGNGTTATIQAIFNGGDGILLQCTDVILSTAYTASNITCSNSTASATPATSMSSTGTASAATGTAKAAGVGRKEIGIAAGLITFAGMTLM